MLRDHTPDDTIVASGVGQHQMWTSQRWTFNHPYTWVNSGGLGTMGFAVPAAIGAKVGKPERMVWAVDGDGCFQMTAQELVTASAERIPVKIAILNNAYLGMVRQWQELFYEERYSEVYLSPDLPDYVKWSEAMGCVGFRVDTPEDVVPTIEKANEIDDRPGPSHLRPVLPRRLKVPTKQCTTGCLCRSQVLEQIGIAEIVSIAVRIPPRLEVRVGWVLRKSLPRPQRPPLPPGP